MPRRRSERARPGSFRLSPRLGFVRISRKVHTSARPPQMRSGNFSLFASNPASAIRRHFDVRRRRGAIRLRRMAACPARARARGPLLDATGPLWQHALRHDQRNP
jgi:hypothetical protein